MQYNLDELKKIISDKNIKELVIISHPHPDPDAVASVFGMQKFINVVFPEITTHCLYSGLIARSQNKTLINVLGLNMVSVENFDHSEECKHFICVDTTPDRCDLSDQYECILNIDHHKVDPPNCLNDIRVTGSCSAIIWSYLKEINYEFDKDNEDDVKLATALLVGIRTDTREVTVDVSELDFDAYRALQIITDIKYLSPIINYPIPRTLVRLKKRLDEDENSKEKDGMFAGGIGYLKKNQREAIPELAEEIVRLEGLDTVIVFAIVEDSIEFCIRSVKVSIDIKEICNNVFGTGFGGGRGTMAIGAVKIPMEIFSDIENCTEEVQNKIWVAIREYWIERIFSVLGGNV